MMPKLVIFDMDGLMIDTEPLAHAGWRVVAREFNITIPDELVHKVTGINRDLCREYMVEALGPDFDFDTALKLIQEDVNKHFKAYGVPLKPGIIQLLDTLDTLGIKRVVATSTAYERALHKLTLANTAHRFHAIIGGDMVAHSKPAPDIFLKAAETAGVQPQECIVLEDSNPGAKGAILAGMRVIVVPDLVPPSEETRKNAFAICNSLYDVCEMIRSLA